MSTPTSRLKKVEFSFNRYRQKTATIYIETTQPDDTVQEDQVQILPGFFNYDGIVSTIITHRYPADKMAAVQNNYLDDQTDADAAAEFRAMQSWRKAAKTVAREALEQE